MTKQTSLTEQALVQVMDDYSRNVVEGVGSTDTLARDWAVNAVQVLRLAPNNDEAVQLAEQYSMLSAQNVYTWSQTVLVVFDELYFDLVMMKQQRAGEKREWEV